ncbi:MAG: hypothetical protein ISQ08_06675, partial [Planctomycetes bacterium]|nr:hypothetical protein [Planctomycetota bacterium]
GAQSAAGLQRELRELRLELKASRLKLTEAQKTARETQRELKRKERELERASAKVAKLEQASGPGTVRKGVVTPPAAAARAKKKVSKQPAKATQGAARKGSKASATKG